VMSVFLRNLALSLGFTNPEALVIQTCKSAGVLSAAAKARKQQQQQHATTPQEQKQEEEVEARASIGKQLSEMKVMLMGDAEKEVDEAVAKKLAEAALRYAFARSVASALPEFPLEACKSAAHVFSNLLRREDLGARFAEQVASKESLESLTRAFPEQTAEVALACGMILKEAARTHQVVAEALLFKSKSVWLFLTDYVHLKNFDVSADAFDLVRVLLTSHKTLAATFIGDNYDFFFECFHRLLTSDNYVTCRESLRLLSDLLLERSNYATMMAYVSSRDNLKIFMLLLRSKKQRIQLETFHVFKVFVANPKKHPAVAKVLSQNKDKLLAFLAAFHDDKRDDQFLEERQLILDTLAALQPPPPEDSPAWLEQAKAATAGCRHRRNSAASSSSSSSSSSSRRNDNGQAQAASSAAAAVSFLLLLLPFFFVAGQRFVVDSAEILPCSGN